MKSGLFLDVVILQSSSFLQLLAGEDEALLIRGNTFFVLDLCLDVVDRIVSLNFKGDVLAGQCADEDLHATAETEDEVEGGLLLDVVILEGAALFKLLAGENQALLIGRDALLVLDLGLDVVDRIVWLAFKGDVLASEGTDEDLHVL